MWSIVIIAFGTGMVLGALIIRWAVDIQLKELHDNYKKLTDKINNIYP